MKMQEQKKHVQPAVDSWLKGYQDCAKGMPHKEGQSEEYTRGYNDSYQTQAIEGSEGE
jgi:hypothetical protein